MNAAGAVHGLEVGGDRGERGTEAGDQASRVVHVLLLSKGNVIRLGWEGRPGIQSAVAPESFTA